MNKFVTSVLRGRTMPSSVAGSLRESRPPAWLDAVHAEHSRQMTGLRDAEGQLAHERLEQLTEHATSSGGVRRLITAR